MFTATTIMTILILLTIITMYDNKKSQITVTKQSFANQLSNVFLK